MNTTTRTTTPAASSTSVNVAAQISDHSAHFTANGSVSADALKSRIAAVIGNDLQQVNAILKHQLRSPDGFTDKVLMHAGQFQGKQIRPVLLLLCHRVFRATPARTVATLAASVEMIHTATLVHDDVLDDARTRRHVDTINSLWNTETSVLLGDFLFSRAFRLAASTGDAAACELIGQATDLTCAGELQQMAVQVSASRSERDYFRIVRGKTGQLFALSCRLGGRCGGASDSRQRQLHLAGQELGMAFQIADDVLDLTGQQSMTGKDSANDLFNQRMTLPLIRALKLSRDKERAELTQALARCSQTSEPGDARQAMCEHPAVIKGVASAEQTARQLVERCSRRFAQLPPSTAVDVLQLIARFAVRRNA